jgi:hypothetical protein
VSQKTNQNFFFKYETVIGDFQKFNVQSLDFYPYILKISINIELVSVSPGCKVFWQHCNGEVFHLLNMYCVY